MLFRDVELSAWLAQLLPMATATSRQNGAGLAHPSQQYQLVQNDPSAAPVREDIPMNLYAVESVRCVLERLPDAYQYEYPTDTDHQSRDYDRPNQARGDGRFRRHVSEEQFQCSWKPVTRAAGL